MHCFISPQQVLQRGVPDDAALVEGSKDAQLVVERLAEAPAMVQVDRGRVVAEHLHMTWKRISAGGNLFFAKIVQVYYTSQN